MNQKWNAEKYSSNFSFVHNYGNDVMSLIDFGQTKSILDIGCGSGVLTNVFHEKGLLVTGLDGSEDMLTIAKANYPDINFIHADATNFHLDTPVDIVFSNAVFHWIDESKQLDMMKCVYNTLNDSGQFVFEMGGHGNTKMIHSSLSVALAELGYSYKIPFYFPTVGQYSALLEKAGFKVVYANLFDRPTKLIGENGLVDWIKMFVTEPLSDVPDSERDNVINKASTALKDVLFKDGIWYADYVRLRMKAVKE